jgi:hypothetical protein
MNFQARWKFLVMTGALLLPALILLSFPAAAQERNSPSATAKESLLKPSELEALVAPIALYPDSLLSLVMMASSYPLEVVQAERWVSANKNLPSDQVKTAVDKQGWDESVKSLAATPSVLAMMSSDLDWTTKLGDAVLAQESDVVDAVQRLRSKAQANNKLVSTKEQRVVTRDVDQKKVVMIESADPNTVHVPYYDPAAVYGGWPYSDYPPYYFSPPDYVGAAVIGTGIAFGVGYALSRWAWRGNYWGGGVNWGGRNLVVNRPIDINNVGNRWQHRPEHRHGVKYGNKNVQQRFGAGNQPRVDHRRAGGDRAGAGDRRATTGKSNASRQPSSAKKAASGKSSAQNRAAKGSAAKGSRTGNRQAQPGRASAGRQAAHRGGSPMARGGGPSAGAQFGAAGRGGGMARGGGGGFRGGGGGRGGGGRRSDVRLKHDIVLLVRLENGLGVYRFAYHGSRQTYVGVMAQEVQRVMPDAVVRGSDGYLRVLYDKIPVRFQTYDNWLRSTLENSPGVVAAR